MPSRQALAKANANASFKRGSKKPRNQNAKPKMTKMSSRPAPTKKAPSTGTSRPAPTKTAPTTISRPGPTSGKTVTDQRKTTSGSRYTSFDLNKFKRAL